MMTELGNFDRAMQRAFESIDVASQLVEELSEQSLLARFVVLRIYGLLCLVLGIALSFSAPEIFWRIDYWISSVVALSGIWMLVAYWMKNDRVALYATTFAVASNVAMFLLLCWPPLQFLLHNLQGPAPRFYTPFLSLFLVRCLYVHRIALKTLRLKQFKAANES